jgi:hypothetical protein
MCEYGVALHHLLAHPRYEFCQRPHSAEMV